MSKNGKKAGAILLTTPTTSTSEIEHKSAFTHHVGPEDIKHAESHNGEYQIDAPQAQEAAKGMEYQPPRAPGVTQRFAQGGAVEHIPDDGREFPEQSFMAQGHNAHAGGMGDPEARHRPLGGGAHGHHLATGGSVDKALSVSARAVKSSRKTFSR